MTSAPLVLKRDTFVLHAFGLEWTILGRGPIKHALRLLGRKQEDILTRYEGGNKGGGGGYVLSNRVLREEEEKHVILPAWVEVSDSYFLFTDTFSASSEKNSVLFSEYAKQLRVTMGLVTNLVHPLQHGMFVGYCLLEALHRTKTLCEYLSTWTAKLNRTQKQDKSGSSGGGSGGFPKLTELFSDQAHQCAMGIHAMRCRTMIKERIEADHAFPSDVFVFTWVKSKHPSIPVAWFKRPWTTFEYSASIAYKNGEHEIIVSLEIAPVRDLLPPFVDIRLVTSTGTQTNTQYVLMPRSDKKHTIMVKMPDLKREGRGGRLSLAVDMSRSKKNKKLKQDEEEEGDAISMRFWKCNNPILHFQIDPEFECLLVPTTVTCYPNWWLELLEEARNSSGVIGAHQQILAARMLSTNEMNEEVRDYIEYLLADMSISLQVRCAMMRSYIAHCDRMTIERIHKGRIMEERMEPEMIVAFVRSAILPLADGHFKRNCLEQLCGLCSMSSRYDPLAKCLARGIQRITDWIEDEDGEQDHSRELLTKWADDIVSYL
jgi:hypothetical protein